MVVIQNLLLPILILNSSISFSWATSVVTIDDESKAQKNTNYKNPCQTIAIFEGEVVRKLKNKTLVLWKFKNLEPESDTCPIKDTSIHVLIWEAQYSTLVSQAIYPEYVQTPVLQKKYKISIYLEEFNDPNTLTKYKEWRFTSIRHAINPE